MKNIVFGSLVGVFSYLFTYLGKKGKIRNMSKEEKKKIASYIFVIFFSRSKLVLFLFEKR